MIKEEIEVNAISHLSEERAGSMGLDTRMHCEIKKGEFKSPQFLIPVNDNIYHSTLTILNNTICLNMTLWYLKSASIYLIG
jgi:hypothetical protein